MKDKKLVYVAFSKHLFYFKDHISKFVLEKDFVPLNPFMSFQYFMLDTVDRDTIRNANNNLVKRADEIWVFGNISDGVLAEIKLAKENQKPIRYFNIKNSKDIVEIQENQAAME